MIYVFTSSNKWGSRLIRWGRDSDLSHMLVSKRDNKESPVVQSTWTKGVHQTTLGEALKGRKVVVVLRIKDITKGELDSIFFNVQKLVGEHYDWKGIAWWAVVIVWFNKLFGRKLPPENKWADKDDMYCSEILFANYCFLKKIGVLVDKYSKQMVDPKRAAEILQHSDRIEAIDLRLERKLNE